MESNGNAPRHEIFITPLAAYGANQDSGQWILATKNEDELKGEQREKVGFSILAIANLT